MLTADAELAGAAGVLSITDEEDEASPPALAVPAVPVLRQLSGKSDRASMTAEAVPWFALAKAWPELDDRPWTIEQRCVQVPALLPRWSPASPHRT